MKLKTLILAVAATLVFMPALAQNPGTLGEGERPPRPDSASNARVGGWCDALTGEKKEQCLRDERRKQDRTAKGPGLQGSCDALFGPDKERCLREGGSIAVGATRNQ